MEIILNETRCKKEISDQVSRFFKISRYLK
jgi:hypothetical protein